MNAPAPRALRFVEPAALATVVLVALWALVFQLRLPGRLPSDSDYAAVGEALTREAEGGDVLVVYPWWADRVRTLAPESLAVVGHLGHERAALLRHPRIWLLAQPELPGSDLDSFLETFGEGRTRTGDPRRFGNLELSLWENGRHRPIVFSAPDAPLAGAQAWLETPDGRRSPCPLQGDRFKCPGPPFLYVRAEWHEVFYEPRRCLWMHPPGGDAKLVVEFAAATVGAADGLLEAGFIWDTFARKGPENTTTTVRAEDGAGRVVADIALTPGLEGMQRAAFSIPDAAVGSLRLSVHSQGADARWICVDALAFAAQGAAK